MTTRLFALRWPLAAVILYLVPYDLNDYSVHVANIIVIFAIMAVGESIALGVAGQVNLAQVAFFGLAAYVVSILTVHEGWSFWPAAVVALLVSVVAGAAVGVPALRMQSHYLGIVTLGLAIAFTSWVTNASMTGGANGISGVPVPPLFGIDLTDEYLYFYLAAVVGFCGYVFARFLVSGPHGRRLRAMRDDSLAATSLGANISVLRMVAFIVSSLYGGVAGVLYAGLIRFVSPESFSMATMFLLLGMVIIGGRQSIAGCVVGTVVLEVVREQLADYATYAQLGYGIVVVLVVVLAPTGLAGIPGRLLPVAARMFGRNRDARRVLNRFEPSPTRPDRHGSTLKVSSVSISFGAVKALADVSFDVPANQIRGLVGPNGSGKTTLFNIISGLYRPSGGSVTVDERSAARRRPHQLSRNGMARTFQNLRLFASMTVRENVLVAADRSTTTSIWRVFAWPIGELRRDRTLGRRADELLAQYGLTDFANSNPANLPYGIQRRVEICRAMACDPSLLLLDEPAAGLNGEEVAQLKAMIRAIRETGVTVLIVEHNMSLVMSLCDQVTVLSGGRVIADGSPAETVSDPAVITAYLGGTHELNIENVEATAESMQ